jgi:glycosyltransferase involved in cell wall biosynthesis
MIRAAFLMEQHVGHKTYYQNLRGYVDSDSRISASWIPITYASRESWLNRVPLSERLRGSLIGREQTLRGLRDHPADVYFFFTQVPAVFAKELLGQVPYVLSTDITPLQYDEMGEHYGHRRDRFFAVKAYKRHLNTQVFRNAARVLPWTQWVQRSLITDYGVSEARLSVVPVGVDTDRWRPAAAVRTDDAAAAGMRILFVGADFARKGGELLLRAFRQLPPGQATLDIVSRTRVSSEPGVRVHNDLEPNSPKLIELFRSCDVFVLPTKADAFGIVAAEASASGLAVIMSDVGGAGDIVVEGETGYLLPPGDLAGLTRRLRELIANPGLLRHMGEAARNRAERLFDASRNGKKVVDTLIDVVADARRRN